MKTGLNVKLDISASVWLLLLFFFSHYTPAPTYAITFATPDLSFENFMLLTRSIQMKKFHQISKMMKRIETIHLTPLLCRMHKKKKINMEIIHISKKV